MKRSSSICLYLSLQLDAPDRCAPSQVRSAAQAVELDLKVSSQLGTFKLEAAAKVTSFPLASGLEAIREPGEVVGGRIILFC